MLGTLWVLGLITAPLYYSTFKTHLCLFLSFVKLVWDSMFRDRVCDIQFFIIFLLFPQYSLLIYILLASK